MWILSLLFLGGCGSLSNQLFLEDAAFLAALPSEAHHTLGLDEDTAKAELGERPELLTISASTATSLNAVARDVLDTVDVIRALPPTARGEGTRSWGPFPYAGAEVSAEVDRWGAGLFEWAFTGEGNGFSGEFLGGTHYAGATVADGDGSFRWDVGLSLALTGRAGEGVLVVDYDNRDGIDLLMDLQAVSFGVEAPLDGQYAWRAVDGVSDFQYRAYGDLDFDDSDLPGTFEVRMRRELGAGGRADGWISGGGLGDTIVELHQCWDAGNDLVWQADNVGYFQSLGDPADCLYADVATVDRLND